MITSVKNYIQSSVAEMKKVTWPTRRETYNYTLMVIGISVFVAAILGAFDYAFAKGFEFLINR
ncbi:MAG: preprotein translocase subunit SecE [Patescibacteria group bacterium]|jgi:preprotein translocase subunit SecE